MQLAVYTALMHTDSHEHTSACDCQTLVKEYAVKWPALPWTCHCGRTFASHGMTLAVVNEKLLSVARRIVGNGRKRLEAAEKGEIRLDAAERAQVKLLMGLAEEALSNP